jgi:hypothetical protein
MNKKNAPSVIKTNKKITGLDGAATNAEESDRRKTTRRESIKERW